MNRNLVANPAGAGSITYINSRDICHSVPKPACREQIEKIVASVTFARAEQLRDLLRWLGGRSLAELLIYPSEKEIAHQVLNRLDFDPRTDALVRKEMGRLREKLSRYYLSEGLQDSVIVTANQGYLTRFEYRPGWKERDATACWLVLPFRTHGEIAELGVELLEEVLIGLQQGGPDLVSPATALAYEGREGDLRQFAAECNADVVVEGSLRKRDNTFQAIVWLVDGQSGRTRRSRRINGGDLYLIAREATAWLLEAQPAEENGSPCLAEMTAKA